MTVGPALAAFVLAASVLTVTPGLDTVLVLRSRLSGTVTVGIAAAAGVALGCLVWGAAVAIGLGAMLAAAPRAYAILRWCGALYLFGCGVMLLARPRRVLDIPDPDARAPGSGAALIRGLLTNLLNPKVGLFYLSFLPQFVPDGYPAGPFMMLLTEIHAVMGLAWLAAICVGIGLVHRWVLRDAVLPWLDRLTGGVFVGFGLKLALDRS